MNSNNRIYKIYAHINKINGKIYIGQTCYKNVNERWKNRKGYIHSTYFYNAIQKYGWDSFEHIIIFDNIQNYKMADIIEIELIKKYQTNNRDFGYNLSSGGSNGRTLSLETRKRMGQNMIGFKNPMYGKKFTKEHLKKLSEAHKGIIQTDEWIQKRKMIGDKNPMYGKHLTDEQKQNLKNKNLGDNNPSALKCVCFNYINSYKFNSLKSAYEFLKVSYGKGRKKRKKGILNMSDNTNYIVLTEDEMYCFLKWCKENNKEFSAFDIQKRYDLYNKYFYETHLDK